MRTLLPLVLLAACAAPDAIPTDVDPFAGLLPRGDEQVAPPTLTLAGPPVMTLGDSNALTVTGDVSWGERVYLGATAAGTGAGPCIPTAGGLCVDLLNPITLLGTAVVDSTQTATFDITPPATLPVGTQVSLQAIIVRSFGGIDSLKTNTLTLETYDGPVEGDLIPDWLAYDFVDDGHADGCVGGDKYVKSISGFGDPAYVGITVCSDFEVKIWLSDLLLGTFVSPGDWAGSGQDHCDYVGGTYVDDPQGWTTFPDPLPCWGRGSSGNPAIFEPDCAPNRIVPYSLDCGVPLPGIGLPAEGDVLTDWTALDFTDDGHADGCAGGTKYVKSISGFGDPTYVGVTLCSDTEYKVWLSELLYGTFVSPGDWAGSGQDHCDYVGGTYVDDPQGWTTFPDPLPCWGRGSSGNPAIFEPDCDANRIVPYSLDCGVSIP